MAREQRPRERPSLEPERRAKKKEPAASSEPPRNVRVPRAKRSDPAEAGERKAKLRERIVALRSGAANTTKRFSRPLGVLLKIVVGCAILAGAVALGRLLQHHLQTSPAFAIESIDVQGLSRMERPELLDAAGIKLGTNVFARSPEDVKARLLKHPWIAEATVSRKLPGSFAIRVREREPVALLVVEPCSDANLRSDGDPGCDDGSALYLVSDDGKLFKRFDAKDPVDLPVVTGIDRNRFGSDPEFHKTILLEVAQLLHDYRSQGLWEKLPISEIHIEPSDGFSLYVGDSLTLVRLGAAPFAQKLPKMKKVFARLSRENATAEYIYLDNEERPDRVTVRLK